MFPFKRPTQLHIHRGRVPCPQRGDVELDACLQCGRLRELHEKGATPYVRCDTPGRSFLDALFAYPRF